MNSYIGDVHIMDKQTILSDSRFRDLTPFTRKIWLSSPTMHGDEQKWVDEAIQTNWVTTIGENISEIEKEVAAKVGCGYAVALSSGTAALHLAIRLAGEKLYGPSQTCHGVLENRRVFCSDMTFDATVNPVAYEGGEAVFIDSELDSWNMSLEALEKAFEVYPETRLIVVAHLYGTPGKMEEIRRIADLHGALIVEDAAESFGASIAICSGSPFYTYPRIENAKYGESSKWIQTGRFGDISIISFNGNKIITGSSGGMLLTDNKEDAHKVRKWSTQSREDAPWYQHEELGYNYRMSNVIAGVIRGQMPHLESHINDKRKIYKRYKEGFKDLPVKMNPIPKNVESNYWLSCFVIDDDYLAPHVRSEKQALYKHVIGKSSPTEVLECLNAFNAEGRPIWKPMHMQPIYRNNIFVTSEGISKGRSGAYVNKEAAVDNSQWIFDHGLCLPSDNKMTVEEQDKIIEIIKRCFQ